MNKELLLFSSVSPGEGHQALVAAIQQMGAIYYDQIN